MNTLGTAQADRLALALALNQVAAEAAVEIMRIYDAGFAVRQKDDSSPVTEADEVAERVILAGLARIAPGIPVVAEESVAAGRLPPGEPAQWPAFWLVDPLDGTREFISRNGEFTVNIALVEHGAPTLGVVLAPAQKRGWRAAGAGLAIAVKAGIERPIAARPVPDQGMVVVASRSHRDARTEDYLAGLPGATVTPAGSSLKFCLVAEGLADLYPRFGRTMEWDTAAGHAVLWAAGGAVETLDGKPMHYAKAGFENPEFVARGVVG
ncbi:3'(2'),5'-bisphosphate nucleotidase CysQ [Zavarzinia sp. CC-PAN008]|uniref:3'(2'),5'-bisphosphate nucleotidase CysQ n=1 Tax=Zavarzinia sp. CC-PAN008 TaxID=3243332 RepID=UPI003F74965B